VVALQAISLATLTFRVKELIAAMPLLVVALLLPFAPRRGGPRAAGIVSGDRMGWPR
jgi:hypothetical protein